MSASTDTLPSSPWQAGLRGAKANLVPGLALQVLALVLVLSYFNHDATRALVDELARVRVHYGFGFSFVSTALCGGLLPLLYLKFWPGVRLQPTWTQGLALTAFWGYKGLEFDVLYRVLAATVGEGRDFGTVLTKMILDQFVYCPAFAVPLTVLAYAWCQRRFSVAVVVADFRAPHWYRRRVLPVLISNFGVWIPAVCIIYTLPTPLQLPLQNIVLGFFTLVLAHLSATEAGTSSAT